jgi:hypothetical protein
MKEKNGGKMQLTRDKNSLNKKAQITMFVILGVIAAFAIIAIFYLINRYQKQEAELLNPRRYIETCIAEELARPIPKIMKGGGMSAPDFFINYKGEKYNYLCYSGNFFERCRNQYPLLKSKVEGEIKKETEAKISRCFSQLKDWHEKRGYAVNEGMLKLNISISEGRITASADKRFEVKKDNETQVFSKFSSYRTSELFEVIETAREIINEEARTCGFEYKGYLLTYPQYKIRVISYSDSKIYKIKSENSEDEFKFAVRGCIYPQGNQK